MTKSGNNRLPPCKYSGASDLQLILDLGNTPIADSLLTDDQLSSQEFCLPLRLGFSKSSGLVQLIETFPEEILYCNDYPYFSSVSPQLMKHFEYSANNMIKKLQLNETSYVIEAGSNDGYMLQNFVKNGIPVLGIEPACEQAHRASRKNISTVNKFLTRELAMELSRKGIAADLFLANNVLAHVPCLSGFVESINLLLKPDGIAVIEVPYVVDMIDNCEFDTIYHQHIYYFSITALVNIFEDQGLFINDVERISIHGGSIRIYVGKTRDCSESVSNMVAFEKKRGVDTIKFYTDFRSRVENFKQKLTGLLDSLKHNNKRIAGYGAAAKATTMMAYINIDNKLIDYVVDLNTYKHGKYMGGNHLKIYPPSHLLNDMPDYTLIFAWNFSEEIIKQNQHYLDAGGRFIIPVPEPRIV